MVYISDVRGRAAIKTTSKGENYESTGEVTGRDIVSEEEFTARVTISSASQEIKVDDNLADWCKVIAQTAAQVAICGLKELQTRRKADGAVEDVSA